MKKYELRNIIHEEIKTILHEVKNRQDIYGKIWNKLTNKFDMATDVNPNTGDVINIELEGGWGDIKVLKNGDITYVYNRKKYTFRPNQINDLIEKIMDIYNNEGK